MPVWELFTHKNEYHAHTVRLQNEKNEKNEIQNEKNIMAMFTHKNECFANLRAVYPHFIRFLETTDLRYLPLLT